MAEVSNPSTNSAQAPSTATTICGRATLRELINASVSMTLLGASMLTSCLCRRRLLQVRSRHAFADGLLAVVAPHQEDRRAADQKRYRRHPEHHCRRPLEHAQQIAEHDRADNRAGPADAQAPAEPGRAQRHGIEIDRERVVRLLDAAGAE